MHAYQWHIAGVVRLDVSGMAVVVKQWVWLRVEETMLEAGKLLALVCQWLHWQLHQCLWVQQCGLIVEAQTWECY